MAAWLPAQSCSAVGPRATALQTSAGGDCAGQVIPWRLMRRSKVTVAVAWSLVGPALGLACPPSAAWASDAITPPPRMPGSQGAGLAAGTGTQSVTLSARERTTLLRHLIDEKPDPAAFAAASALLPGAGEVALGQWTEPVIAWGALLAISAGVYYIKTRTVNIHPAYLATTPYVLAFGVSIPGTQPADDPGDFYNRFLQVAYLGAAAWTGYRSYEIARQQRAELAHLAQPLTKPIVPLAVPAISASPTDRAAGARSAGGQVPAAPPLAHR